MNTISEINPETKEKIIGQDELNTLRQLINDANTPIGIYNKIADIQKIFNVKKPAVSIQKASFKTLEEDLQKLQLQKDDDSFDYWGFKIPRKELSLLCAYTGHGKTAFAVDIAINMRKKGLKVAFITCEMSSEKVRMRAIRNILSEYNPLHTMGQEEREEIEKFNFDIYDTTSLNDAFTLSSLQDLVEQLLDEKSNDTMYDAIFLDYLQFIDKVDSENKKQLRIYYKDIASYIQSVAQKHNIYFVCTAQTNKEAGSKFTMLENGNIAESSDIVRNAGYVIGIFKMVLNQKHSLTTYEKKDLEAYQKKHKELIDSKQNSNFLDLTYLKEQKTRQSPLIPHYRLLSFNYGLAKVICDVLIESTNSNNRIKNKKEFILG